MSQAEDQAEDPRRHPAGRRTVSGEDALREALADVVRDGILNRERPEQIADALLPVVLRYGREKAAEKLRAAAEAVHRQWDDDVDVWAWDELNARADALTALDPT